MNKHRAKDTIIHHQLNEAYLQGGKTDNYVHRSENQCRQNKHNYSAQQMRKESADYLRAELARDAINIQSNAVAGIVLQSKLKRREDIVRVLK